MDATTLDPIFRKLLPIAEKAHLVYTRQRGDFAVVCSQTADYLEKYIFPLENDPVTAELVEIFWDVVFKTYWNMDSITDPLVRRRHIWGLYCVLFTAAQRIYHQLALGKISFDQADKQGHNACAAVATGCSWMLDPNNFERKPPKKVPLTLVKTDRKKGDE